MPLTVVSPIVFSEIVEGNDGVPNVCVIVSSTNRIICAVSLTTNICSILSLADIVLTTELTI